MRLSSYMAGQLNIKDPGADFLSKFVLYRANAATDTLPPSFNESIDFTKSPTATKNVVQFIAKRTAGTGKVKLFAFVKFADAPAAINTSWVLHKSSDLTDELQIIELIGLLGYVYKFAVEVETGGATFDLYAAVNQRL